MIMALIQVTPEVLNSKATEVRNLRSQHDDTMARLRSLILALNETWKGEAQAAFVAKFESMQSSFTSFSEMLEGYATPVSYTHLDVYKRQGVWRQAATPSPAAISLPSSSIWRLSPTAF